MDDQAGQPDPERVIDNIEALKIYFDPLRTRIIRTMAQRARSVPEIAQELGIPFTRLYYHINMLEKHGLIRMVGARSIGGAVEEKFYRVAARQFIVAPHLLTVLPNEGGETSIDAVLHSMLEESKADLVRSISAGKIDLMQTPPHPNAMLLRHAFSQMSGETAVAFQQRLFDLLDEFSRTRGDAADTYYNMFVGFYPSAVQQETGKAEE